MNDWQDCKIKYTGGHGNLAVRREPIAGRAWNQVCVIESVATGSSDGDSSSWACPLPVGVGATRQDTTAENAKMARRRMWGLSVSVPMVLLPLAYPDHRWFMLAALAPFAILGYITVVYTPRWIVGGTQEPPVVAGSTMPCGGCGSYNDATANFCRSCGRPLAKQT